MENAKPGPYVVDGHLFFRLLDGSTMDCICIEEPFASQIVKLWKYAWNHESIEVYDVAAKRIEDYDRREAAGEDVSGEIRPRMPGGSDF